MKRLMAAVLAASALVLTACGGGGGDPLSSGSGASGSAAPKGKIVVASANFVESQILASIYEQALVAKGVDATLNPPVGSRETYYPGLLDGSFDLVPEYTGVLLQHIKPDAQEKAPDAVYTALKAALPAQLAVTEMSKAEDKDAVVLNRATATKLGVTSLDQLGPRCGELVFGGPPEFQTRPDGIPGLKKTYNCTFKEFKALDAGGPLTVNALKGGAIQAADLFTTDASIAVNDFVVLADPKNNFAAQNVVPLVNKAKATDQVTQVLNAVSAKLTTAELTKLNAEASSDAKPSVETVAKNWLAANQLG